MKRVLSWLANSVAILIVLGIGVAGFGLLYLTAPRANVQENVDTRPIVRAYRVKPRPHRVQVRTHGTSQAGRTWSPTAEVPGRIVERDPSFEAGELIRAGTVVVKLDDTEHRSAINNGGHADPGSDRDIAPGSQIACRAPDAFGEGRAVDIRIDQEWNVPE